MSGHRTEPSEPEDRNRAGTPAPPVPSWTGSVAQAAARLGISERAVRKRLQTGTLAGERTPAGWVVTIGAEPGGGTGPALFRNAEPPAEPDTGREISVLAVRVASLEAELEGAYHQLAFAKDQLEVRREEAERMREEHARQVEALTSAIGEQAAMLRALQAQSIPPQLVEVGQTGNAPVRLSDAPGATMPPFVDDETLKRRPLWRRLWPFG